MMRDGIRRCDACEEVIPKGTTYNKSSVGRERAAMAKAMFGAAGVSFTENPDGSITVDLCLECYSQMGFGNRRRASSESRCRRPARMAPSANGALKRTAAYGKKLRTALSRVPWRCNRS
jgi:hypothetical protein